MKNKIEHWAVIEPSHLPGTVALVIIDSRTPSTIYWNGGPGYMTQAKYKILEDIHVDLMTDKGNKALDELELHMYRDHYKYEPAIEPLRSEGWISPNGAVYYCAYGEHRFIARVIVAKVYNFLGEGNSEKYLEDKKWLKLYQDGMVLRGDWDFKCTQAQIDAMGWLCEVSNNEPDWIEKLKDNIEFFEVE